MRLRLLASCLLGLLLLPGAAGGAPLPGQQQQQRLGSAAQQHWFPLNFVEDVTYQGAIDLSADVRSGAAYLQLVPPIELGGVSHDGVLIGEGFLHFVQLPGGVVPRPHSEDRPRPAEPVLGPRLEVLPGDGLQLLPEGRVLVRLHGDRLAVRWTGLIKRDARGARPARGAIVEALVTPDDIRVQYLHVPPGIVKSGDAAVSATSFRLVDAGRDLLLRPRAPVETHSSDVPPAGCIPAVGTWCDYTGPTCAGGTPCSTRVEDRWNFSEGGFCENCPYVFYVLIECGREMHFPMYDMEALDMTITNMVTGTRPDLRCINETALGLGPDNSWGPPPNCPGKPGPWWPPPLDVTNNGGQGRVIASDSTPDDGDCTTRGDLVCADLPVSGVAPTVVHGEQQIIDCYVQDDQGLCGIYRIDMISGGNVWQLYSNCDGSTTPTFNIYWDCTEAWAAYNPLPELGIKNASAPGLCWTYNVSFEVENIGCVDEYADVPVRITSDCGDLLDVVVPGPIPAHGSVLFSQPMTLGCPEATLTIVVDPDDIIIECTESPTAAACDSEAGNDMITVATVCCPAGDAGASKVACQDAPIALFDAASQFADIFSWNDGGVGGTFTPSADIRNPTYQPPPGFTGLITLELTVTYSASGCSVTDTVTADIREAPNTDAGSAKTACVGDAIPLLDADAPGADEFTWSDGGAGGIFEPSPNVAHPSYRNAVAGDYTLSLVAVISAGGCSGNDTVLVSFREEPVVSAGPDQETCEDTSAILFGASAGIAHDLEWSDSGAGGTFVPSSRVLAPTYEAPGPGIYSLTLSGSQVDPTAATTGTPLLLDDMEGAIGPHWSPALGETSPSGRSLLGRFSGNQSVTLDLSGLPPHSELSLCFDVLVVGSWDGHAQADPEVGPDLFEVRVNGGATLLRTSFAALAPRAQAFPDEYVDALGIASPAHPARTGAVEIDSLGYGSDAVQRVSLTFAHSDPTLRLVFQGFNLEGLADESWGLDDVYVGLEPCASCTVSDTLELTVNELPGADAGLDTAACEGELVSLDDAAPGSADVFSWSDGGAGGTFHPSADVLNPSYEQPLLGTFTLTLTATSTTTGCVSVDEVDVTIGDLAGVSAGPDRATCSAQPLLIDGAVADLADTFLWSDGGEGGAFTPNNRALHPTYTQARAGIFTLTFTATDSVSGCSSVDTMLVQVNANPLVEAGADKTGCASAGIPLDDAFAGAGTTLLWSDGGAGGTFSPSSTVLEPAYSNATPGTYVLTLTATRPATGCVSTSDVGITVLPNPAVNAGIDKTACAGANTPLSDATSSGSGVSWSDLGAGGVFTPSANVLNPSYRNDTPGSVTLRLTATTDGCSVEDTLVFTVAANPAVNAGADKDACVSQPVALADATSSADTFLWSDAGAGGTFAPSANVRNPTYSNASVGVKTLTLTATVAATGCQSSDTVQITVRQLPVASFAPIGSAWCEDVPVCFDNTSNDGTAWNWSFGAGGNSTAFEPCFIYSEPGTYTVTLTASNICGSDPESMQINIAPKPVAQFTYSTQGNKFCKDKAVQFTDQSTGGATSWEWDFGDGNTSTAQNPSHTYLTDGLFIVSLRACNACGCGPPRFQAIVILATCQTNCEANSNQIGCTGGTASVSSNTCTSHGNFNTSSYPCAPGLLYTGNNMTWNLTFTAGSNFIVRLIETEPEPNGYDLDIMISDACNPPNCVSWGDTEVLYDDRTAVNDQFYVIVDGRDGTCGPYTLEVECISPAASALCTAPAFAGIISAEDADECSIPGILVTWPAVTDWGNGPDGLPCAGGTFEIWRAPVSSPNDFIRVGTAPSTSTSFLDVLAVPRASFLYKVNAINDCCAQPALTTGTDEAMDDFGNTIEADAGSGGTVTCNAPTVQLLGTASGGTGAGFAYSWSPVAGLSDPGVSNPTATLGAVYTMTATDLGDGCSMTDVVVVIADNQAPMAEAGPDGLLTCTSLVATLQGSALGGNASGGYSYAWSPAALVANPTQAFTTTSIPGTYTLTVTALATGCVAADTVTVTQFVAPPAANAGPNRELTCANAQVTLEGSVSGGNGSAGWLWAWTPAAGLDNPTSPTPVASGPGTWTLFVTDVLTGCTDSDSVVVVLNDDAPIIDAGPDRVLGCGAAPVMLDGSALGGDGSAGYAFSWSLPEAVSDPSAENPTTSVPGTYVLTVTDVHTGCTATDTVNVAPGPGPVAEAGPPRAITCVTGTVSLAGSASGGDGSLGYTYSWSPAGLVSDPASPNPDVSTPGSYVLTVTSIADGCSGADAVLVADLTVPPVTEAGPDSVLTCADGVATLEGSASGGDGSLGYSYAWSPPGQVSDPSSATPTTTQAGTYTLTVTDIFTGCTSLDSVTVSSDLAPPLAEAGPSPRLTCGTTSVPLLGSASGGNGSEGYAFSWAPAGQVGDPSAAQTSTSAPGLYVLTVTDLATGCTAQDTVTVDQNIVAPTANAGPDVPLACGAAGVSLTGSASGGDASAGYAYHWEPAGSVSDPDSATTEAQASGTYVLTVTALATGCTATDSVLVTSPGAPAAEAGPADSITCADGVASLLGSASGGNTSLGRTFLWSPATGVANPNAAITTTTVPGTYTLQVTDVATGCVATDSVLVVDATGPPVAEAGPSPLLTCAQSNVTLQGSAIGDGSMGWTWSWQPAALVSDPAAASPTTATPGNYLLTVTSVATGCSASDTVVVLDGTAPPVASAGGNQVRTCANPLAILAGSAGGGDGSAGYAFAWTPAGNVSNPAVATPSTSIAGTYTLTVTDLATGCMAFDTVLVTDDFAAPVASAGPDKVLDCESPFVQLNGAGSGGNGSQGYFYAWEPADDVSNPASATPLALSPGTFTLTVTDRANGCTATDSVLVTDATQQPIVDAGPAQFLDCDSSTVTLQGSASGGNGGGGYLFAWEPSGQVADPDSAVTQTSAPGTYSLTVTDIVTGCIATDTVVITQDLREPRALAGPDRVLDCAQTSVTLAGSASGGNASMGYSYSWQPAGQVSDPSIAQPTTSVPGAYILTVTALATACSDTDVVIVTLNGNAPLASAGPDKSITCNQSVVTLNGAAAGGDASQGYMYAWEPAGLVSNPAASQPTTTTPGIYTVTVTSVANGCSATDEVEVFDATAPPVVEAGPDQLLDCDTSMVTLAGSVSGGNGSAGFLYSWSPGSAVSNPNVAQPTTTLIGTYVLTVTDVATGCVATDSVIVGRDERRPIASAGPDLRLDCLNPQVTLQGSASGGNASLGYAYSWTPASFVSDPSSPNPTTTTPGNYTLMVTAVATGCTATDTVVVIVDNAPPVADAGEDVLLDCNQPAFALHGQASGGNGSLGWTFSWSPEEGLSDPASATPTVSLPGTYTLTVTDLVNGCTGTDEIVVTADFAVPVADAGGDQILDCGTASVTLTGSASGGNGGAGYDYSWEPAGAVLDPTAAETEAIAAGDYTLTVTDLVNGCSATDTVTVTSSLTPPIADAGPGSAVTCVDDTADLVGQASGGDGSLGYLITWSPAAGVADPSALVTTTTLPGTYALVVEDIATGCRSVDTVLVANDRDDPVAEAGPLRTLTCTATSVVLLGQASGGNGAAGYSFAWEPAGDVSDPSAPQPTTSVPGTYTLTVTDLATGCASSDGVTVVVDMAAPLASAGPDVALGCWPSVTLQGEGSAASGDVTFSWAPAGNVSDPSSPTPSVSLPGTYVLTVTGVENGCVATDLVTVGTDATPPVAEAGPDLLLSCAVPTLTLQGSASGGLGGVGYAYSWAPPDAVSDPTAAQPQTSSPGVYVLTVTDLANGCTAVDQVNVTADIDVPVANAGPDAILDCGAAGAPLTGSASGGNGSSGYSFRWEPAGAVSDPDVANTEALASGTFTLTVTDLANGCQATDTAQVTLSQEPPVANAGPDSLIRCDRPAASLQGSASGGDGRMGYSAAWSPVAGVANPSAFSTTTTLPGNYTLTVTDIFTGCRAFDTVTVTSDTRTPAADAGTGSTITCFNPIAPLVGSATGGNGSQGYTFEWSPLAGVANPFSSSTTTTQAGTYTLLVTDRANGCTATDTVTIVGDNAVVTANAGPDKQLTCLVFEVTLEGSHVGGNGGAGFTYAWTPAVALSDPSSPNPVTSTAGVYTLRVTDLLTGCTDTDTVRVSTTRTVPNANAGPDRILTCNDPVVTLAGGPTNANFRYAWAPAGDVSDPNAQAPTTSTPGTYTLTVTDVRNGCNDIDLVEVTDGRTPPAVDAGPDKFLTCATDEVVLEGVVTGGAAVVIAWEPAGQVSDPTAPQPIVMLPGTYTLTVTDLDTGCVASDVVEVILDLVPPGVDVGPDLVLDCTSPEREIAATVTGTGPFNYEWSPADGLSDATIAAPVVREGGTYVLTVTDLSNGCVSADQVIVTDNRAPPVAHAGDDVALDCGSGGVALSGSASGGDGSLGYAYAWDPPAAVSNPTSATTTALAAGTFTLTVTDRATGCTAQDVVLVTSTGGPIVTTGPDNGLRCSDGLAELVGSVTGGSPGGGRQIQWIPSAGVADPASLVTTASIPGTYTLIVLDIATGCSGTAAVTVAAQAELPVVSAGPDRWFNCIADIVTLQGSATGGDGRDGFTYSWEPAGLVSDPLIATPTTTSEGLFTLTVTDVRTGCVVSDQVQVATDRSVPVADAGPDVVITCNEPAPLLQGSASGSNGSLGYAYSWSPAEFVTDPDSATPGAFSPGTFTLTVTDLVSGCSATDTVEVTRDPNLHEVSAGADRELDCASTAVTLIGSVTGGDGSLGFRFAWEPAANVDSPASPVTDTQLPGLYTLTVTDIATGCVVIDTVLVTQDTPPVPVEPSAVDVRPAAIPLRITWQSRATSQALATWEPLPAGLLGRLYQGNIASLTTTGYDHGWLACGIAPAQHVFRPAAGNLYFLVTGANCRGEESSYGRSSLGTERPDGQSASGRECP